MEFGEMERGFMGLNVKDSVIVKEEVAEGGYEEDSDFARSSGVPWSLPNKMAAPQNLSLKPGQDEKPTEMKSNIVASQGYMLKSGSDIFVGKHKQKLSNSQSFGGANMKQQFPCENPFATSHCVTPSGSVLAGAIKEGINPEISSIPAQLIIFYGGTVSVFNGVSPEKVQAIKFLAGSACVPSKMAQSEPHLQALASKFAAPDQAMLNQNMPPGSGLPTPMSVSSHPINQTGVLAANNDVEASKSIDMATTFVSKVELPRVTSSIGAMIHSAVPQRHRASLARFLEKRKERVMNAAPYKLRKDAQAPDCASP